MNVHNPDIGWTDQRIEDLKRLREEGYSASQIADLLGGGLTRNAIIGKAKRLGLKSLSAAQSSRSVARVGAPVLTPTSWRPLPSRAEERVPAFSRPHDGDVARLSLVELTPHTCKWPVGDPLQPGFGFCGEHTDTGPYCARHAARSVAR